MAKPIKLSLSMCTLLTCYSVTANLPGGFPLSLGGMILTFTVHTPFDACGNIPRSLALPSADYNRAAPIRNWRGRMRWLAARAWATAVRRVVTDQSKYRVEECVRVD